MKEISCIQQYVIDNLINNKIVSIENLIDAIAKTCSTEQFNNILSILIKEHASCTNKDKVNFVEMSMFIPEEINTPAKLNIIKILQEQFNFSLRQIKEYVDSCIGKYSILPKTILQTEVDEITKKLEPYGVLLIS